MQFGHSCVAWTFAATGAATAGASIFAGGAARSGRSGALARAIASAFCACKRLKAASGFADTGTGMGGRESRGSIGTRAGSVAGVGAVIGRPVAPGFTAATAGRSTCILATAGAAATGAGAVAGGDGMTFAFAAAGFAGESNRAEVAFALARRSMVGDAAIFFGEIEIGVTRAGSVCGFASIGAGAIATAAGFTGAIGRASAFLNFGRASIFLRGTFEVRSDCRVKAALAAWTACSATSACAAL